MTDSYKFRHVIVGVGFDFRQKYNDCGTVVNCPKRYHKRLFCTFIDNLSSVVYL